MKRLSSSILLVLAVGACGDDDSALPDGSTGPDAAISDRDAALADGSPDNRTGSDGGPLDSGPDPDGGAAGPHAYSCTPVGRAGGDGVFSLASFRDRLYAGEFGYGREDESQVSTFPSREVPTPGLRGIPESVCALKLFNGMLYANTESSGDIFRTSDGASWERVHDGDNGVIGCGLEVFEGALYAVNFNYATMRDGRILRTTDGASFAQVWGGTSSDWSPYLRDIVAHDGMLYALGTDLSVNRGFWLSSPNGRDWTIARTPTRFLRGHSWNGALYFGSTDYSSQGPAGVYRMTSGSEPALVEPVGEHYVADVQAWDDALFAGTSSGWKDDVGTSRLLLSRDGTSWQAVCDFDELAVWALEEHDGHLYVGTWQFGSGGQVYRVDIDPEGRGGVDPTGGGECDVDPANPPTEVNMGYREASYTDRHNWVHDCFPYAYTAGDTEHEDCDSAYHPDGTRSGTATFSFTNIPAGHYDVYIGGRHTTSRTSQGMRVVVDGHEAIIQQHDSSLDFRDDLHGRYCLSGNVEVLIDSTRFAGSDSVSHVILRPAP